MSEEEVIRRLFAKGVREFVVCGGARNALLIAHLVELQPEVQLWTHFDERAAAFFALGRTKATSEPCAVVTTSGTAVAECLPAVIEASYSTLPLVIVSADRPEEHHGRGTPQAIEQEGIFCEHAYQGEDWDGWGPWHLNAPLGEGTTPVAPIKGLEFHPFEKARRNFSVAPLAKLLGPGVFRGLWIMVGGLHPEEREEVYHFCRGLAVPVLVDATSGLREMLADLSLAEPIDIKSLPGRILRLGEVPVGRLWRDLEDCPQVEVVSVCRNGLPGLARPAEVIQGDVRRVLQGLGPVEEIGDVLNDLPPARAQRNRALEKLEGEPDTEAGLVRTLSLYASTGESLFLGNSLPIREWNRWAQTEVPYALVRANRGVNGIDGQIATWLGATAEEEGAWGVFGDLTTLYDGIAPTLLQQLTQKGRVLIVVNNGGGRIFDKIPRLDGMSSPQKEALVQPIDINWEKWANLWNLDYLLIRSQDDFDHLEAREKCLVVELRPS